jgi:hypothetical protein
MRKMAAAITIVYEKTDDNSSMAQLLNDLIKKGGLYEPLVRTKAEQAGVSFEAELLGNDTNDISIFIGKIEQGLIEKIEWRYDEFGMKYGWNGKKAILLVEKKTWNKNEVEGITKLLETEHTDPKKGVKDKINTITSKIDKLPAGLKIAGAIGGLALFGVGAAVVAGSAYLINGKINNDKVFESQKKFLVNKFYTEAFDSFMAN